MSNDSSRREFLKISVAAACAVAPRDLDSLAEARAFGSSETVPAPGRRSNSDAGLAKPLSLKKGVLLGMLPQKLSYAERFKMARDVGFEALQVYTTPDPREADEIKKAAEDAKISIDSVMNEGHWQYPLSSDDPAVVAKSLDALRTSLHNAQFWGAPAVLLVPAVVNPQTSYRDAWARSQRQIRKLIPLAQGLGVIIALEEVWNKFLLSPLEFATYIDEFKSPWIRAWFDVGNVVLYGYPQDWIRTLGKRIIALHLKDFKWGEGKYEWANLGDGDINWAEVRGALAEIGYTGTATTELEAGDAAYLRDLSSRVDRLVLGA